MDTEEATTVHRTPQDETADRNLAGERFLKESWKDWPNKAAFQGLQEYKGPIELHVKGTIPAWAAGDLYRTGPGLGEVEGTSRGTHRVSHWFDGFAHTHKFSINPPSKANDATTVVYSSKRQSDKLVERIKKEGWRSGVSFAQRADPCIGIFAKLMSVFKPQELNNNVAVHRNVPGVAAKAPPEAGRRTGTKNVYLVTDSPFLQEINAETLEPIGPTRQSNLHPDLKGKTSCAHAEWDHETGDLYNFNLEFGRTATYRIFRVNAATGTTDILATVSEPGLSPAYIHSFFMTENYVILCVPSSHFAWAGMKILWKQNLLEAIEPFDEAKLSRWIVVDRRHGKGVVARFSTPAGFFFHSVNAFEERVIDEDKKERIDICMDYVSYKDMGIMFSLYYDIILDRDGAANKFMLQEEGFQRIENRLVRHKFRLPLSKQTAQEAKTATAEEALSIPVPHAGELPTINPRYTGKPYRYAYGIASRGFSTIGDSIVKTDLHTREATLWCGPAGNSPSEAMFVARPGGTEEDDGVLLSVVLNAAAGTSYLLCLDARTMEEMGRAEADFAIALGLHGTHAPLVGDD